MLILELVQPGTWIDDLDDEVAFHASGLLWHATTALADAAVALAHFDSAQADLSVPSPNQLEADREHEDRVRAQVAAALVARGMDAESISYIPEVDEQARLIAKRERWASGRLPDSYQHRLPFIHATTFLFALDNIGKSLRTLARLPGVPEGVRQVIASWPDEFPDLVGVRDSAHHADERAIGEARQRPIETKPIDNGAIKVDGGGVIVLGSLRGRNFGNTMADGHYGEVEVSEESARKAQALVQKVLDAFNWSGPSMHLPH